MTDYTDYIERGEAIKAVLDKPDMTYDEKAAIILRLHKVPAAADVAPVVHAHWRDLGGKPDLYGCRQYECSHCKCGDDHDPKTIVPYCWYCGAKMDEEVDND